MAIKIKMFNQLVKFLAALCNVYFTKTKNIKLLTIFEYPVGVIKAL